MPDVGDVVEVSWVDHLFQGGAYKARTSPLVIHSVGYLVSQDEQLVVIAQSMASDGHTAEECLYLISGCVVEVRPMKRRKA